MALPGWIKPQLTKLVDQAPDGPDWLHEIKFDGYRMHARLDRGAVRLLTRTGLDWTHKCPPIAATVASLPAERADRRELFRAGLEGSSLRLSRKASAKARRTRSPPSRKDAMAKRAAAPVGR